tara:strand:+ start:2741 stop:4192 length:1452 start_codon:yes stop_codon:yes gene_type:complete
MIRSIGKYSKSFFLKLLVGIIILPFIFWGMGDIFRGGNQNVIATVDSEKIGTQEFVNYLNRLDLSTVNRQEISKTDLLEKILSDYIGKKIINYEIESLGIKLTDKSLSQIIKNDQTFFKDNKFSRTEYEKFLLTSGITAPILERNIAEQEKKRQLLSYLAQGISIPDFYINHEYNRENQTKEIHYVNLKSLYNKPVDENEIKEVYEKTKNLLVQEFKSYNYINLKSQILTGKKNYDENYFKVLDEIENNILDGKNFSEITKDFQTEIIQIKDINSKSINIEGKKVENIEKNLLNKLILIKDKKTPELIKVEKDYFLAELTEITKKNLNLTDQNIRSGIEAQVRLKNKIKMNTEVVREISEGKFNDQRLNDYIKNYNLELKYIKIDGLKKNQVFSESVTKRILETKDGEINLITDGLLKENFIIKTDKTYYKKISQNSDDYEKFKLRAKLNISQSIYNIYDKSVNKKYNVEINKKTFDRIKNSL